MTPTNVLVVEDERIIAKGIEKQLKSMGYAVAGSASSGEDAVRKAVELRPDLILMDVSLGAGIDGIEAATRIRQRCDIPVVYLTANSDDATLQRAKLTDPLGYVLKPYEDRDLQTAIEIGLYRHKMERRVRENEQWLAATLGSIGDGVIATDEQGRVRFLNALAEQLTGWTQADALGRDVREVFRIVGEKTRQPVPNPALDALAKGEATSLAPDTILIDRAGVERPIDDSAAPIRDLSGRASGAVLVFRDIGERRRMEDHLRQSQKLEAVGLLAAGVAHELNNIMTVIGGFSELLLDEDRPAHERRDLAQGINEAGKRAAALTLQITAFGRKQFLVPCVLDLGALVRDMGVTLRRLIGPGIEFLARTSPDLMPVMADPTQVAKVVQILAENARDAMPGGGRLTIETANADPDASGVRPGRYAVMSVSDTGCGMAEGVLARAFEPFFTTKGFGQGTGLGLAIVHGIVAQSGGFVEASSLVGRGSCFRVHLPEPEEKQLPLPGGGAAPAR